METPTCKDCGADLQLYSAGALPFPWLCVNTDECDRALVLPVNERGNTPTEQENEDEREGTRVLMEGY